jgi:hypothetical protein
MEHVGHNSTADSVLAEGITQKNHVMVGYCKVRGNGGEHFGEPPVSVRGICRAIKQAFTRHPSTLELEDVMDIWKRLTTVTCDHCKACTEAEY